MSKVTGLASAGASAPFWMSLRIGLLRSVMSMISGPGLIGASAVDMVIRSSGLAVKMRDQRLEPGPGFVAEPDMLDVEPAMGVLVGVGKANALGRVAGVADRPFRRQGGEMGIPVVERAINSRADMVENV